MKDSRRVAGRFIGFIMLFIIGIFLVATTTTDSFAGKVEQEMRNFLFSNSNTNYTSGGAYKSQGRGYYATPSVYTRNPVMDTNIANVSLPEFRAGCGGIDMFAGSFSHINSDQFIALMKAIPSNAAGYAFKLALETLSPSIANVMSDMETIMRTINNANLNSCKLATIGVESVASRIPKVAESRCINAQMKSGQASDIAEARRNCTSGGQRSSTLNSLSEDKSLPVNTNYAWKGISNLSVDTDFKEFLQSITGTIVVQNSSDDNSAPQIKIYPSLAEEPATIEAIMFGGTMQKYRCDETNKCLNVSKVSGTTIPATSAFHFKISKLLHSILDKMQARDQEPTTEEKDLINATKLPLIAILRTYKTYYGQDAESLINDSLAEIVAYDLLYSFLDSNIELVYKISSSDMLVSDFQTMDRFLQSIQTTKDNIQTKMQRLDAKRTIMEQQIDKVKKIEKLKANILVGSMYESFNG